MSAQSLERVRRIKNRITHSAKRVDAIKGLLEKLLEDGEWGESWPVQLWVCVLMEGVCWWEGTCVGALMCVSEIEPPAISPVFSQTRTWVP